MLDTDTKRRIDTARDILVGKVPDPKSQVEQITIALIYKFMADMDADAEELGGKRKFFAGDWERYGWPKLMRSGLGGHEVLALYSEAIAKMPENDGIPVLFRDIFKNAYLPYRDPETLKGFLKIIDEFEYDHSERLGDAFEYLLSVLGSQGDAGQFRTPRHIIDFMIGIIDPKKDEVVLDPACGTAGFLISAYKHILRANSEIATKSAKYTKGNSVDSVPYVAKIGATKSAKNTKGNSVDSVPYVANTLTPEEKGRLAKNFRGYDISPDMVRLSLVNLYLHGFNDPHIYEYDTLTSEEKWTEFADVILANPPFMSPKGGIKPHKRFSVQSKRSEVLFVDYIAEHLTPNGRAAIIVPEGIIFQSQNAYKQLRQMLVDTALVAVISLPAGVFQPYSGVKTSILILDKSLAKQSDRIGFFKVENDGYNLGAQRRAIDKNDMPQVKTELTTFLNALRNRSTTDELAISTGLIVPKEKIAENGDYNLSGERYRAEVIANHTFPLVSLGEKDLFRIESGGTPKSAVQEYWGGVIQWATLADLPATDFISEITETKRTITEKGLKESSAKMVPANSVIVSTRATIGRIAINRVPIATNQGFKNVIIGNPTRAITEYVALALTKLVPTMQAWATGGTFAEISKSKFCELQMPLPPLEVQKEIVAEIEGYQKVIDGARAVLDNYLPHIPIHPDWPMVELEKAVTFNGGFAFKSSDLVAKPTDNTYRPVVKIGNVGRGGKINTTKIQYHKYSGNLSRFALNVEDIVMAMTGATVGKVAVIDQDGFLLNQRVGVIRAKKNVIQKYILNLLCSPGFYNFCQRTAGGGAQGNISPSQILEYEIPLPPLATQQAIVTEIEAEQALVNSNRELITRFEQKIQATLSRIWGDEKGEG
ncbi:MAG: N-6 DNA methylase [Nitrospirales bacterium]